MAALITSVLLLLFGLVLLAPLFSTAQFDEALKESLKFFLTIGVGYYLGTSQSSAKKDETISDLTKEPK